MFPSVEGQVSVRETWRKSSEDKSRQFAVLDGVFADGVMREWHGLDLDLVPRVWEGLRLLHDLSWQDGAESSRLCWHEDAPLALAHGLGSEHRGRSCPRCAERFRCERCWTRNEWHSGCEG